MDNLTMDKIPENEPAAESTEVPAEAAAEEVPAAAEAPAAEAAPAEAAPEAPDAGIDETREFHGSADLLNFSLDDILNEYHDQASQETMERVDAMDLDSLLNSLAEEVPDVAPPQEEPEEAEEAPAEEAQPAAEEKAPSRPLLQFPNSDAIRQLKKKIISGPEKRYYDLSEVGVLKLQIGILLNLIIVALCLTSTTMYAMDMVPANRMKLLLFSQVLAMLGSGLLGCHLLIEGLGEIFHLKFSVNTILAISFFACCADVYFCIQELRVPCCAAFALEMTFAMFARYHKRTTEMAQMDTMRKAIRLTGLVKEPDYYEGRTGILRTQGDVEDFMETYSATSGPEKAQSVFAFLSFMLCVAIAAVSGILHSVSMAFQIFATSLLVAVPASFFVALTRPTALLEKRLHMVGTVICGWQGVRKLCGKAVFPLTDSDLFPRGATKVNGLKFYSNHNPDEIVSYTASLILAAGGGLVPVFRNLLNSRNVQEYSVVNFRDYGGGGIGGEVNGEPVLVGSMRFLQDMGVEIPQGTMVNQAVYASIDGQLAAVIAISYAKMRSSAAGLVSLCGCRKVTPILLAGDFMLTEDFIRSKFNVRPSKVAMPPKDVRAALAQKVPSSESDVLALVTRDDLVASAYAVCGAVALRRACRSGVFIHILAGLMGMLIMLALAYLGSTELLTPINVLLYQLIWAVPGLIATQSANVV